MISPLIVIKYCSPAIVLALVTCGMLVFSDLSYTGPIVILLLFATGSALAGGFNLLGHRKI